jgi:hypothetical protein
MKVFTHNLWVVYRDFLRHQLPEFRVTWFRLMTSSTSMIGWFKVTWLRIDDVINVNDWLIQAPPTFQGQVTSSATMIGWFKLRPRSSDVINVNDWLIQAPPKVKWRHQLQWLVDSNYHVNITWIAILSKIQV